MATLSFRCGHELATFVHVRPGGPGHDQPPPQEPEEPTALGNPCAPGAPAPERPKPGPSALGGLGLRRPRPRGLTFISAELAVSFRPRFTRKRRPSVCSMLSRWLSWTPAWRPHPILTQVGLGTSPPRLPCLQESSPAWMLDVAEDPRWRVQSWHPAALPHSPQLF